jgi:hypothetical protein
MTVPLRAGRNRHIGADPDVAEGVTIKLLSIPYIPHK